MSEYKRELDLTRDFSPGDQRIIRWVLQHAVLPKWRLTETFTDMRMGFPPLIQRHLEVETEKGVESFDLSILLYINKATWIVGPDRVLAEMKTMGFPVHYEPYPTWVPVLEGDDSPIGKQYHDDPDVFYAREPQSNAYKPGDIVLTDKGKFILFERRNWVVTQRLWRRVRE